MTNPAANPTAPLRSRIVATGNEPPDQLLANPLNWRVHPRHQQDAVNDALERVGWVQQVIVNRTTGHLIDGHLRVTLADRRNEPTIPVLYVELDPDEERLILATLDPLAGLAVADRDILQDLIADLPEQDDALTAVLQDLANQHHPGFDPNDPAHPAATEQDLWPVVRLKLSPDTLTRWNTAAEPHPDDDTFANHLLNAATPPDPQ